MATTKPRITITLPPEHHEVLRRLAAVQGTSMSALVGDLLGTVIPVLERVCVTLERAANACDSMKDNIIRAAEESERALQPHLDAALGQVDWLLQQVEETTGAPAAVDPRPVITGVRSPVKGVGRSGKGGGSHEV